MKLCYKPFALLLIMLTWACGSDDNLEPVGDWELTSASLSAPVNNTAVTLDEDKPDSKVRFEWTAATTSNRFVVQYTVLLLPAGTDDAAQAVMTLTPGNNGRALFVETTADDIDYALWTKCYPAGQPVNLKWTVVSKAVEKTALASQNISFTRFVTERVPETLFITGAATEAGADVTQATAMRALLDADGNATQAFEVYITLTSGSTYTFRDRANVISKIFGGKDKHLEECGAAIVAPETGIYRVTVDLNTHTYDLLKIDRWSLVGDVIDGSWNGDVALTYQGKGVWGAKMPLFNASGTGEYAFRANGDWGLLLKRIKGSSTNALGGKLIFESDGNNQGIEFENLPAPEENIYTITLDLSGANYTYKLVGDPKGPATAVIGETLNPKSDAVSGNIAIGSYAAPGQLFLVADGEKIVELTKDGDSFKSGKFVALEKSKKYILNSASDGSGTTYNKIGDGSLSVAGDQAYQLTVDFSAGKLTWKYYNMKLFHWSDTPGGWDVRKEFTMTYVHPYTFEVTAELTGGNVSKFNSPWDVQFGTADTALSGTMTNSGSSPNYPGIIQSGTYKATIVVADDYSTADYTFVKQ